MEIRIFTKDQIIPSEWNLGIDNPTQLFEFANTSGKFSIPYFMIIKNDSIIFKWQFFVVGFKNFRYINIISEPNIQDTELLNIAFKEILGVFNPFKIVFYSITLSKFTNIDFLERHYFDKIYRYGSSVLDLTQNEDAIFSNIHSKHRNIIRRAQKENIQILEDTSEQGIHDFQRITIETYARSNKPSLKVEYLLKHFFALNKTNRIKVFFAKHNGIIQAGAIFIISDNMSIYWHGGSINNCILGSSNLLQWEAIRYFKKSGIARYDFGGCSFGEDEKSISINRFKDRFGGELRYYFGGVLIYRSFLNAIFRAILWLKNKI